MEMDIGHKWRRRPRRIACCAGCLGLSSLSWRDKCFSISLNISDTYYRSHQYCTYFQNNQKHTKKSTIHCTYSSIFSPCSRFYLEKYCGCCLWRGMSADQDSHREGTPCQWFADQDSQYGSGSQLSTRAPTSFPRVWRSCWVASSCWFRRCRVRGGGCRLPWWRRV